MAGIGTRLRLGRRRTVRAGALAAAAALAVSTAAVAPSADAVPARGNSGWSVLLCRFSDVPAQPQTPAYFGRMFGAAGAGQEGLYDYFRNQSYGKLRIAATVRGWYRMPFSVAQEAPKSRGQRIQDCVDTAAANGYTVPAGNRTAVITNAQQDSGSAGGRVLLDPGAWNIRFAAHEMGHGYGLDHSFSDDLTYQNASWSQPGEYDDMWDEMSAQHVYGFNTTSFGNGGVGLNAFGRDKLGFLPRNRIRTFGSGGATSGTVQLAALQQPSATGSLLLRVPFDPADPFHYYTVEFQRRLGWSQGIPADTVLIHEVRNGRPTLLRQLSAPGQAAPPAPLRQRRHHRRDRPQRRYGDRRRHLRHRHPLPAGLGVARGPTQRPRVRDRRDPVADRRGQRRPGLSLGRRSLRTAHLRAGLRVARGVRR